VSTAVVTNSLKTGRQKHFMSAFDQFLISMLYIVAKELPE
jgi:hypothetical protein